MALEQNDNARKVWSIGDILREEFPEEEWLIESLVPGRGIAALSGSPGEFKTWLCIHIALAVSRGAQVFNKFTTKQGSVLVVDEEDNLKHLQKRFRLLGAQESDPVYYLSQAGLKLDNRQDLAEIKSAVAKKGAKLVVLDSLVRLHQQNENDAVQMARVFGSVQEIVKSGAAVLFTHHHRKQSAFTPSNFGQSMRGSSDILAAVDCHIAVERKEDEPQLILRQTKLRQADLIPHFEVNIHKSDDGPTGFEYAGTFDGKRKKAEDLIESIISFLTDGMRSRGEIIEKLKEEFGRDRIDEALKLAKKDGSIEEVPKDEVPKKSFRKLYYRIREPEGWEEGVLSDAK